MLVHYVFVRKDLSVGVLAAMVTHAAGESAAQWYSPYRYPHDNMRFNGATAVVLEATDEEHLNLIDEQLSQHNVDRVKVYESEGKYHDQFMAIGIVPAERDSIGATMRGFNLLTECKTELDNYDEQC